MMTRMQPQYRAAWAALSGEMAQSENAQTQLYQKLYGTAYLADGRTGL